MGTRASSSNGHAHAPRRIDSAGSKHVESAATSVMP
jgi:hypothetical protein